jgi:hypothetical protein
MNIIPQETIPSLIVHFGFELTKPEAYYFQDFLSQA